MVFPSFSHKFFCFINPIKKNRLSPVLPPVYYFTQRKKSFSALKLPQYHYTTRSADKTDKAQKKFDFFLTISLFTSVHPYCNAAPPTQPTQSIRQTTNAEEVRRPPYCSPPNAHTHSTHRHLPQLPEARQNNPSTLPTSLAKPTILSFSSSIPCLSCVLITYSHYIKHLSYRQLFFQNTFLIIFHSFPTKNKQLFQEYAQNLLTSFTTAIIILL